MCEKFTAQYFNQQHFVTLSDRFELIQRIFDVALNIILGTNKLICF